MKRTLIAVTAVIGGLWALVLLAVNAAGALDGIAYTLPDDDEADRRDTWRRSVGLLPPRSS